MKVIVGCLVIDDDKVLMVQECSRKKYGLWNYPTGHLEKNESIIEGAIRETYEETGYKVNVTGLLPIQEIYQNNDKYILIRFICDIVSYDESHKLDGVLQAKWMKIEDVFRMNRKECRGYDSNRRFLKNYLDNNVYPVSIFNK